ncbi:MAG: hypothetical protein ACO3EO_03520, partial [Candidatus Kapaibacteriota bacterium]
MGKHPRVFALLLSILVLASCSKEQSQPEQIQNQKKEQSKTADTMPLKKDSIPMTKADTVNKDSVQLVSDSTILGIRKDFPMPSGRVVNVLIT